MLTKYTLTRDVLYVISGPLLVVMAFGLKSSFRIDPMDAGLILNQQATHLTSKYTDHQRDQVELAEFIDEVRSCEKNFELYSKNGGVVPGGRKIKDLDVGSNKGRKKLRAIEDTHILRRWRSPSIAEVINYHNVIRYIVFNTAIYFKFRVVNKRM